jgi:alpha/beta superfamily hydrolase
LPRRIESLFIEGPAGRLEALLEEPDEAPSHACLVCHPHPRYAGTMHNKVVYRIARGFRRAGAVVLRFNFRSVNLSEGSYDGKEGEVDDARAALQFLRSRYPELPYSMAGFSFGSRITLRLGCALEGPKPKKLVAVGFPTVRGEFQHVAVCGLPKFFVQSTNDEYGPVEELRKAFADFPEPKQLEFVEARDHFFDGGLPELEDAIFRIASA